MNKCHFMLLQESKPSAGCIKSMCTLGSNKEAHPFTRLITLFKKKKLNYCQANNVLNYKNKNYRN